MSTESTNPAGEGGNNSSGETPPADGGFKPITSQEELNRVLKDRLDRERAKFADYAELKAKAAKLDEIEEANKSEAEKVAERLAKAEAAAREAEARALRREIALEHGLSKEDAALLDAVTDEDAMRRLAARLAEQAAERGNHISTSGAYVPAEGKTPPALNSDQLEQSLRKALGVT